MEMNTLLQHKLGIRKPILGVDSTPQKTVRFHFNKQINMRPRDMQRYAKNNLKCRQDEHQNSGDLKSLVSTLLLHFFLSNMTQRRSVNHGHSPLSSSQS